MGSRRIETGMTLLYGAFRDKDVPFLNKTAVDRKKIAIDRT